MHPLRLQLTGLLFLSLMVGCRAPMQSVEEDRSLGLKLSKMVAQEYGTITDTVALKAWVKQVGDRLVKALPNKQFEYSFQIVDMAEPNAFAVPGGPIYISRGLLALVNTEDELAGVIAHEIIHVHKRHTAQQIANQNRGRLLLCLERRLVTWWIRISDA